MLEVPTEFSTQRRYVNRFKLGADPEFVFLTGGLRCEARHFKVSQGLAFGMDNNGRLMEIRPWPHRSALHVTASILLTLRFLAAMVPKTLEFDWVSGAFLCGDGLGGHVHFGRKRPNRNLEVKALDAIEEELLSLGVYPAREVLRRRQGDEHHQIYGALGDVRAQRHGYEYRTFPSWLDSPELAFLTITLSKLAVHNPRLTQGYLPLGPVSGCQRIKNLLAYYKDVDDDARLALMLLAKRWPMHMGGDFKRRWGITGEVGPLQERIEFLPSCIKPSEDVVQELFKHFVTGTPLGYGAPKPTWQPLCPPDGYVMTIQGSQTHLAKGLGELLWDVCQHQNFKYTIQNTRDRERCMFLIPRKLAAILPADWRKFCGSKIEAHGGDSNIIYSAEKTRGPETFDECRRLLLETVLPFWPISKVKPDSWQQWKNARKPVSRYAGKIIYGDESMLPIARER
jgi:hypothetical protein